MSLKSRYLFGFGLSLLLASISHAEETPKITTLQPESVVKPFKNRFSQGKLIPAGAEWLFTAGQTSDDVIKMT